MSTSPAADRHFLFLLSSARAEGNTELLARRAAASLPASVKQTWVSLDALGLPPFLDLRHTPGGYPPLTEPLSGLYRQTVAATDLVFVAPTYWYSLPTSAKLYLDHWSGMFRVPGLDFRAKMVGRTLWLVTVNSDDPGVDEGSAPLVQTLRLTADYMKMRFGGAVVGHGSRPGDVLQDAAALAQAEALFVRGPASAAA
ncbi:NAD(P)H-dependent oxidoreductase [Aggregicoccus sp. 17bor-14]|uniref:flavodoxin family protein n=1 Tax=Myxococcaceae TaxID=31 RepID=UPI00129C2AF4|nr:MULTISPECIES: NAD(P)H-dependent oxidoreductase [Myxococcaceae]MBF5041603.1 NAD(P)H-dependent oxidoreductase [Simulacricoccus sp. 17bor-14]MRI87388.1 NAD(P)H-dependent oxidoreductase [Aggregicoccus sp. 17bor-14]